MQSKLKERLGRLGRVRDVVPKARLRHDRVASGSPVDLILRRWPDRTGIRTIDAAMALARRGMTLLRAKRAIEAMLDDGEVAVEVPTVEDFDALARELSKAGVAAARIASDPVDVRSLRLSLGMSQEQFARRFNLDLDALQNWEQGRRSPERAVCSYLRVIAADPEAAARAQEEDAGRRAR
jgi:putative transcriptional regulator